MDQLFRVLSQQTQNEEPVSHPVDENDHQASEFEQFDFQQINDSYIVPLARRECAFVRSDRPIKERIV